MKCSTHSDSWFKAWHFSKKIWRNGLSSEEMERRTRTVRTYPTPVYSQLISFFALALSKEFVENAVRLLVSQFMPLNPSDLEQWMADPEEWLNEEERDEEHWEYEIRACFIILFLRSMAYTAQR